MANSGWFMFALGLVVILLLSFLYIRWETKEIIRKAERRAGKRLSAIEKSVEEVGEKIDGLDEWEYPDAFLAGISEQDVEELYQRGYGIIEKDI